MKTLYIAGPMRGYERYNFDAFDAAEADLTARDFKVRSPATLDREIGFDPDRDSLEDFDMSAAVMRDVAAICKSEAVVLLPGWERSTGANAELHVAKWIGLPALLYPDLKPLENEDVLEEALRLTSRDRNKDYGPPDKDFACTAGMWSSYLGCKVEPKDVAWMMLMVKASRSKTSNKRDHYVDAAGYARCGWLCVEAANG